MSNRSTEISTQLARWASGCLLAVAAHAASAAVLVAQHPWDDGEAFYANPNFGQQLADDFALDYAVNLQRISWWGIYDGNFESGDDSFTVRIYSDLAGGGDPTVELSAVAVVPADTGLQDVAGNTVFRYDYDLASALALSKGNYYLFVENLGPSDWAWLSSEQGVGGSFFRTDDDGPAWEVLESEISEGVFEPASLAFSLEGERQVQAVPEPPALALLGLAGLALLIARRRSV